MNGFVARFGDQVLGIPQDPTLRNLSLVIPYILAAVALLIGITTLLRLRRGGSLTPSPSIALVSPDDDYRTRLEDDLKG
jgi:hypothetical protein